MQTQSQVMALFMARMVNNINVPMVRASILWLIGEYSPSLLDIIYIALVRKKIRKRRLFKKVQAFCEEKVLRCLLGVFWYAESKNQCWQAEKWRLHYLICIFPRWPPN